MLFAFMEDTAVPVMGNVEYTFGYEDVRGFFGRTVKGFMLKLEPSGGDALYLWCTDGGNEVRICGNLSARLYRFALWVGYGLMTLPYGTIASTAVASFTGTGRYCFSVRAEREKAPIHAYGGSMWKVLSC